MKHNQPNGGGVCVRDSGRKLHTYPASTALRHLRKCFVVRWGGADNALPNKESVSEEVDATAQSGANTITFQSRTVFPESSR
jgi:hypothetical protein